MKVYVVFDDGTDEEFEALPEGISAARAIEIVKQRLGERSKFVKSFEVEEDFA